MSKKLTKQWRDGTIELGYYYCFRNSYFDYDICSAYSLGIDEEEDNDVCDVFEPVPDYHEWKATKKKLKIAIKALKEYKKRKYDWIDSQSVAKKALKEIKELV